MPIRHVADQYHVSPQITPEDIPELRQAGITTVICNRPDDENPTVLAAAEIRAEVEAAGLRFVALPFNQMTLTPDIVAAHRDAVAAAAGPVLAYCASGNRSTVVWALGQAESGARSPDDLVALARAAGYELAGMKPTMDALAARGKQAG